MSLRSGIRADVVPVLVVIATTQKPVDRVVPLVDDAGVEGVLRCRMPEESPSGRTGTHPPVMPLDLGLSCLQLLDWPQDGGRYEGVRVLKHRSRDTQLLKVRLVRCRRKLVQQPQRPGQDLKRLRPPARGAYFLLRGRVLAQKVGLPRRQEPREAGPLQPIPDLFRWTLICGVHHGEQSQSPACDLIGCS